MFRRAQYKIVLGVLLFIMVIYVFGLIYTQDFPNGEIYYIVKQQSNFIPKEIKYSSTVNTQRPDLSLSEVKQNDKNTAVLPPKVVYKQHNEPGEIQQSTTKQPNSPPGEVKHEEQPTVPTTVEIVQHLVNLTDGAKFTSYVKSLSSSQVNDVVKYMGVSDLTSRESQEQFLICAGMKLLLKQLKDKPPNSSIQIPSSFQHCKTMSFKSSKSRAVLESFPGSGNSYVRQLLESATGIYTGAIYCDPSYLKVGMIGEGVETENVLAIKSHVLLNPKVLPRHYDKAIYIVRNPFDAMVAEINRLITYNTKHEEDHTAVVDYEYVGNSNWTTRVKGQSQAWKKHVSQWLNTRGIPVLFVGYENLRNDTYTELKRMLDFLGYPYSDEDVLCTVRRRDESFHRNHTKEIHPYSPELQTFVNSQIKQINNGLQKHNILYV